MSLGLVGRKIGMTRIFTDDGDTIPVTVVDVSNNRVSQIKTPETDGYSAVQLAFGKRRRQTWSFVGRGDATADVELALYRIAQEALRAGADLAQGVYVMPPFNRVDLALRVVEILR